MLCERPLDGRQAYGSLKIISAEHMDPAFGLQLVLIQHDQEPPAEIEEVVPHDPRKGPSFELVFLDRLIPSVCLFGVVALQDVEEPRVAAFAVLLEKREVMLSCCKAVS